MHEVWFAIPSACPDRCRENLPRWREMGYRVAVLQNRSRADIPADLTVWADHYPGWAESINILCRHIVPASASIVVSGGDDMLPDPYKPASQLADEYSARFPDGMGVMQPAGDDFMWSRNYCGSPWFARPFFSSMYRGRGPMHGGYRHNWADYELYWVARCRNMLWMRDDVTQYHAHFTRDGSQRPEWWKHAVEDTDRRDCELFLTRKYLAFPGHEPLAHCKPFDERELLRNEQGVAEWRWNRSYAPHSLANAAADRMTEALKHCAARNLAPVAVYGAGTHTRKAAHALAEPAVTIDCIIDDNPDRRGTSLWGYPIVSLAEAIARGVRAVILSSDMFEQKLWDNAAPLRDAGVEVIRLYTAEPAEAAA